MIDEERLSDLLLTWEERFEKGEDASPTELCSDCPELKPALANRIQLLKKLAWLMKKSGDEPAFSDDEPILPSTLAGRYRLDERIAEGGFGVVWRGYDEKLQCPVAIKVPKKAPPSAGRRRSVSHRGPQGGPS